MTIGNVRDNRLSERLCPNLVNASLRSWSKIVEEAGDLTFWDPTDVDQIFTRQSYDLTSPREWLEFCEARTKVERGRLTGDPYTVLRCDYSLGSSSWKIWGMDFHLDRLKASAQLLKKGGRLTVGPSQESLDAALLNTRKILDGLLQQAQFEMISVPTEQADGSEITFMVTILWEVGQPPKDNAAVVTVQGHAFSALRITVPEDRNPNAPVKVTLGYIPSPDEDMANTTIPNRYENLPEAKLSSWCRDRRPLETLFKQNQENVGDVILTRGSSGDDESDLQLLEGLTSNLFVVCTDNVIRTAPSSLVLGGYVRERILEGAITLGYEVVEESLFVQDVESWKEVFLTSSIRLIIPVSEILLPVAVLEDGTVPTRTIWKATTDSRASIGDDLVSEKLYQHLLQSDDDRSIKRF